MLAVGEKTAIAAGLERRHASVHLARLSCKAKLSIDSLFSVLQPAMSVENSVISCAERSKTSDLSWKAKRANVCSRLPSIGNASRQLCSLGGSLGGSYFYYISLGVHTWLFTYNKTPQQTKDR